MRARVESLVIGPSKFLSQYLELILDQNCVQDLESGLNKVIYTI
jgi:hypothetical protein